MAENEAAVQDAPEAAPQEETFAYPVKVEEVGPATKKVTVEIPAERISGKLAEQFKELRQQATIPGFRQGHAPQKLVEKRFSADAREQVRRELISESYQQAVEKNALQVIGEPEFDNPDAIKLPDSGALSYSFQVEVQPEINLPELKDLKIKKPKVEIKEENVDQAMTNLREQQGTLVPVEDRGVQAKDYLVADVHAKVDGNEVVHQHDAQIVARPGRVAGLQIDDLDKQLEGMKPNETRTISVHAPEEHPNEQLRGKDVQLEVKLKDIKRLEAAEINAEFLENLGFANEQELREALREQMQERITADVQQAMREQVNKYLLENVSIELPAKLSERQVEQMARRRVVDLMMRGMPREQVDTALEQLRGGVKEEAQRDLKLFFILQKIAAEQNVDVDEAELNGRIAMMAAQRGQRPEKLKQEMGKDGSLSNLYVQMREQKAIDKILETAQVEEVEMPQPESKE
jgi:trigger factor